MMGYLGDFPLNAVVRVPFNTNAADGSSITRSTNGTIKIYKNNSTTERSSSAGITDTEDFDTTTGIHHINIDLADNTDAGFYAAGNDYLVELNGANIDGKIVNAWLAEFSIQNRVKPGIKRGVGVDDFMFYMQDIGTLGPKIGLVDGDFTKQITKDGGSPAALIGSITEVHATNMPGFYKVDFSAAEMDATVVGLYLAASGVVSVGLTLIPAQ